MLTQTNELLPASSAKSRPALAKVSQRLLHSSRILANMLTDVDSGYATTAGSGLIYSTKSQVSPRRYLLLPAYNLSQTARSVDRTVVLANLP